MEKPSISELMAILPQLGRLEWIGVRPEKRADLKSVMAVQVSEENGLDGDHYQARNKKRQVTLIQAEHLAAVATILGKDKIDPGLTRRNLVVSGTNLLAFKDRQFQIGEVILEMTGHCHPCSRMEENLGEGAYNAMRGHGGITARVIKGGTIRLGDECRLNIEQEPRNNELRII